MKFFCAIAAVVILVGLALSVLSSCDPKTELRCDYCHVVRDDAYRYMCEKCQGSHVACEAERAIKRYREAIGIKGFASWSATALQTCPAPTTETEPIKIEVEKKVEVYTMSTSDKARTAIAMIALSLFCYFKGRIDGSNKP